MADVEAEQAAPDSSGIGIQETDIEQSPMKVDSIKNPPSQPELVSPVFGWNSDGKIVDLGPTPELVKNETPQFCIQPKHIENKEEYNKPGNPIP